METAKVALVTAGGSGMGAAAARRLSADGFRVGILSSSGKGEALASELGGVGVTGSNQSGADCDATREHAAFQKRPAAHCTFVRVFCICHLSSPCQVNIRPAG